MIARFDPFDTFFFRDGKPFSLGDETWADGLFPPAPSVLYGALRTLYLARNGGFDLTKKQLDEATKDLKIRGVFLEYNGRLHLPLPFDVVKSGGDDTDGKNYIFKPQVPDPSSVFSSPTTHLLRTDEENVQVEEFEKGALIKSSVYAEYLKGKAPIAPEPAKSYLQSEAKIGIGRNNSKRTVSEGELFRVDMQRLISDDVSQPTKIVVDFEFSGWMPPANQLGKLGGEGKTAFCSFEQSPIDLPAFPNLKANVEGKYHFKLCLTTPAIFKAGWHPSWLGKDLSGTYQGIELRLLAAATNRLIPVGGWDMKTGKPKTMYKAVPAGAVYCF
jgi:CRISPR-associated protein Cmr3